MASAVDLKAADLLVVCISCTHTTHARTYCGIQRLNMNSAIPTPESLALSANIFTAQIASWIPASFAPPTPSHQAEAEWQAILRTAGEGKDRLGLGHPDLNAPRAAGYGAGIKGLEKSLQKGAQREQEKREWKPKAEADSESEEEESRSSMIGKKRKGGVMDLLGGKKGKQVKVNGQVHEKAQGSSSAGVSAATPAQSIPREESPVRPAQPVAVPAPHLLAEAHSTPSIAPSNVSEAFHKSKTPPSPSAETETVSAASARPLAPSRPVPPVLLHHESKLSKNARKKARQRAKKAAAAEA